MFSADDLWSFVAGAEGCYDYAAKCEKNDDLATARQWYEVAAEKGSAKACFWLAEHHKSDTHNHFQYMLKAALLGSQSALQYIEQQAAENSMHAQFTMGNYFYAKNDQNAAASWWAMAFARGFEAAGECLKTKVLSEKILEQLAELYETGDALHKRNLQMALAIRARLEKPAAPDKLLQHAALEESATTNRESATLAAWGLYKQLNEQGVHEARRPMKRLAVIYLYDPPESAQAVQRYSTVSASDLQNKKPVDVEAGAKELANSVNKLSAGL